VRVHFLIFNSDVCCVCNIRKVIIFIKSKLWIIK